ncbi:serine/threonine-protein kinase [Rhizobacter sp. OV335]|uniref:serine/threonine protein kinase n=1 Tax=Rhizobacter sp. OV335 TaxID=1500264 RepID=UPI0009238782|nr:serine/threonine-protein kinase [Rhizobacter sp. OV335]SHN35750.1 non-specific serine/threonine protein kinase [Rhizobacter sp. OV335]
MSTPTGSAGLQDEQGALRPGTRLGEFEILRVLGVGGFGIVYLAMDHALERQVAIKEYMPAAMAARGDGDQVSLRSQAHLETFGIGLRSFVNEAKLLARFDHPSLVKVYRFWEANGTAYMVMPYYAGRTLKEERKALAGVPSDAWIRGVIDPLLGALQVLHDEDVFHRDIAPDNILLLPSGLPVLLDFGAARRVIGDRTQTLTAILKPNYAPIEQYADVGQLRQGPWTDLYALGAVLHFVITGRPPVPSAARAVHDDAKPLAQLDEVQRGTIGQPLLRTIDWALAVRPSHRPQNVAQFRDALDGKLVPPERPLADGEATQPVSREQVQAAWSPTQPIDGQATVFQPTVAATQPGAPVPVQSAGAHRAVGAAVPPPPPAPPRRDAAAPAAAESPKRRGVLIAGIAGVAVLAIAAVFAMKGRGQPEVAPTYAEPSAASAPAAMAVIEPPASAPVAAVVEPAVAALPAAADTAASEPAATPQADAKAAAAAKRRAEPKTAVAELPPATQATQPAATTAPAAAAPAEAAGPKTPGEACGARKFLARLTCILRECETNPAFHDHPHCVRARELEDERKRKELSGG